LKITKEAIGRTGRGTGRFRSPAAGISCLILVLTLAACGGGNGEAGRYSDVGVKTDNRESMVYALSFDASDQSSNRYTLFVDEQWNHVYEFFGTHEYVRDSQSGEIYCVAAYDNYDGNRYYDKLLAAYTMKGKKLDGLLEFDVIGNTVTDDLLVVGRLREFLKPEYTEEEGDYEYAVYDYGLYNAKSGKLVLEPSFDAVTLLGDGYALAEKDGGYSVLSADGSTLTEFPQGLTVRPESYAEGSLLAYDAGALYGLDMKGGELFCIDGMKVDSWSPLYTIGSNTLVHHIVDGVYRTAIVSRTGQITEYGSTSIGIMGSFFYPYTYYSGDLTLLRGGDLAEVPIHVTLEDDPGTVFLFDGVSIYEAGGYIILAYFKDRTDNGSMELTVILDREGNIDEIIPGYTVALKADIGWWSAYDMTNYLPLIKRAEGEYAYQLYKNGPDTIYKLGTDFETGSFSIPNYVGETADGRYCISENSSSVCLYENSELVFKTYKFSLID